MASETPPDRRRRVVTVALTSAVRAGGLTTLHLTVPMPELAIMVRGHRAHQERDMDIWQTSLPASDWHDELSLVAAAPRATKLRRLLVNDAATLVSELLSSEQRRMQAELLATRAIELAGIDALTQLGNRRTWLRAIEDESARGSRYDRQTSIAVIDLDGLKRINDVDGHAAGDAHLLKATKALRASARGVDVVCRLGGDEFGVLAPETGSAGAARLATRLMEALAGVSVRASIGVATSADGSVEAAWQEADAAMYRSKRARAIARATAS